MNRLISYAAIMLCASQMPSYALNGPSNLKATAVSSSRINLRWTDNAEFESSFIIQRSTDGTNFAFLASVGPNVTRYGNTGLQPSKTYWYRVRAFRNSNSKVSAWSNIARATTFAAPTPTKKIIHWQAFSNSGSVSSVVANHTYIDTLPFDGIVVKFPDYQNCLGPNYSGTYASLYNQLSPMRNLLSQVKHNCVVVLIGNSGMVDPFDDWTAERQRWINLAMACRDAGLEGIFFDDEEYRVHMWQYPNDCKYATSKTVTQYREQWRLRGTRVMQDVLAQWPRAKILVTIGPNRSVTAVPAGAMFNGDPNWMGGYFFMGLFAGAPVGNHVINGGELYYNRTVTQFSNWKNFFKTTLTQSPQSPRLMPSSLYSTWTNHAPLSFGIYDQDRV